MNRTRFAAFLVAAAVAAVPGSAQLAGCGRGASDDPATITHVLNRLTFGPRSGDVDRVRQMGLAAWLDQQLHPARIDDHAAEARLPQLEDPPDSSDPKDLRRFAKQQVDTLASAKVLRAVYSERQLQEVLVDFWFNHFNVRGEGTHGGISARLRARRDSAARLRSLPRSARGDREESRDALLPGQLAERGSERGRTDRGRRAGNSGPGPAQQRTIRLPAAADSHNSRRRTRKARSRSAGSTKTTAAS